jgi:putative transposase
LRSAKPEIFNTDQGSQFTSGAFTELLEQNNVRISMDGRGRVFDNIFIERLWRTVKYEEIYLHDYQDGMEAYIALDKCPEKSYGKCADKPNSYK